VVITIIGILIALLLPAVQPAREAAVGPSAPTSSKQIGLALHNYHAAVNSFPHGTRWPVGAPNWRASVLPYIEQNALYQTLDISSQANIQFFANDGRPVASAPVSSGQFTMSQPIAVGQYQVAVLPAQEVAAGAEGPAPRPPFPRSTATVSRAA